MGHHGCGRNCFARSHDPAYGLYAASRVRFAGLQKRSPPLTPLRDNRLPTVRRTFQYQSRYWRESFVCTLDTGRLMGGPFCCFFCSLLLGAGTSREPRRYSRPFPMPGWRRKASSASRPCGARPRATRLQSLRRARQLVEPPTADPHGGWYGGRELETSGYPIMRRCPGEHGFRGFHRQAESM